VLVGIGKGVMVARRSVAVGRGVANELSKLATGVQVAGTSVAPSSFSDPGPVRWVIDRASSNWIFGTRVGSFEALSWQAASRKSASIGQSNFIILNLEP